MASDPPYLDTRTFEDIVRQVEELARSYLENKWVYATSINTIRNYEPNKNSLAGTIRTSQNLVDGNTEKLRTDVGIALSKIFALFYMNILTRLNKLPKRNFIEFLNIMGFNLSPPIASRVPVSFKLAEGAKEDVFVPSGTILASDANDKHEELIFETEEDMRATKANILQLYAVNKKIDAIYSHTENLKDKKNIKLFPNCKLRYPVPTLENPIKPSETCPDMQQHILYLGHLDLFNLKNTPAKIFLTIQSDEEDRLDLLTDEGKVVWEYVWKYDDKSKEISAHRLSLDSSAPTNGTVVLEYMKKTEEKTEEKIEKIKINGIENYWIRCCLRSSDDWNITHIRTDKIPAITKITAKVELDTGNSSSSETLKESIDAPDTGGFIKPDLLFYKDAPIQVPSGDSDNSASDEFIRAFGKQPFTFDIFYIASTECFSKKNTVITLKFFGINPDFKGKEISGTSRNNGDESSKGEKSIEPTISWEYWNGKGWNGLSVFSRKLEEENEELEFLCPNDMDIFPVNGNDNYWIRARLVSGDYGKGKLVQRTVSTLTNRETRTITTNEDGATVDTTEKTTEWNAGTFEWDYIDIKAPQFKRVEVKFTDPETYKITHENSLAQVIANTLETLKMSSQVMCMTYNNLEYAEIPNSRTENDAPDKPIRVFKQFMDCDNINNTQDHESKLSSSSSPQCYIYLGFDKKIEGGPILIYVSVIEERNYEDVGHQLNVYYYSPTGWKKLYVEDGTKYFTKKGYIKLFFPSNFQTHSFFGDNMYWIKIEDSANRYIREDSETSKASFRIPKVKNLILNTVSCINAYNVQDESLAKDEKTSSNYKFQFSKKPLTLTENRTEQVWVKEKVHPSDLEWSILSSEKRIRTVKDALGNILETWVLWKELGYQNYVTDRLVQLTSLSQHNPRIYSIDRVEGKLNLGSIYENSFEASDTSLVSGENFPSLKQIGADTLLKANYIVGGGSQGNINTEEVKTLKSLVPFIDSVTNPDKGRGGSDTQSVQDAMEILPSLIKNRGQAVTAEDFESLIMCNFPSLSRVKCFPTTHPGRERRAGEPSPGHVLVVVIPKTETPVDNRGQDVKASLADNGGSSLIEEMPYPSVALLRNIKQYLSRIASETVVSQGQLHITGPSYYRISISANLYVTKMDDLAIAEKKALDSIKKFLDPLKGGKEGKGWEYRKVLTISDVYILLSSISEVEDVDSIVLRLEVDESNVFKSEEGDNGKPSNEYILSETNNDINAITSKLLPHTLLCEGNAHNLTMKVRNHK